MFHEIINSFKTIDVGDLYNRVRFDYVYSSTIPQYKKLIIDIQNTLDNLFLEKRRMNDWVYQLERVDIGWAAGMEAVAELEESGKHKEILKEEIRAATIINKEFAQSIFLDRLLGVAGFSGLYWMVSTGPQMTNVIILMDEVAGNLEEYARAVTAVRAKNLENREGVPKAFASFLASPSMRSHFWAEKFYGVAVEGKPLKTSKGKERPDKAEKYRQKYFNTIESRLALCESPAPFWELLDKGVLKMSSDIGGVPYPVAIPTNFVNKAIARIKNSIAQRVSNKMAKYTKLKQDKLRKAYEYIAEIEMNIGMLEELLFNTKRYLEILENPTEDIFNGPELEPQPPPPTELENKLLKIKRNYTEGKAEFSNLIVEAIVDEQVYGVNSTISLEARSRGRVFYEGTTYYTKELTRKIRKAMEGLD